MTTYIKISTLEYPRYEGDIRLEHPEIFESQTYPNFPCPNTYALVVPVEMPSCNYETQTIEELLPIQNEGVWTQQFLVRDLTDEELQLKNNLIVKIEQPKSE